MRKIFVMHKKTKTSIFRCWMKLFWHPKNPLSKENSVKPALLSDGRSFLRIFMILCLIISLSLVGCVKSLGYQDFEIISYEWNSIDGQPPFHMDDLSGQIIGSFILKVRMNRNDICLAVYDNNPDTDDFIAKPHSITQNPFNCKDRKSIFSGWAESKSNKLRLSEISVYNILFDNINSNKELDICASLYMPFNMSSQGVICKKFYVPAPKIDVDIVPKELLFTQNKETYWLLNYPQQKITITNTGETVMDFGIFVPEYFLPGSFIVNNLNAPYYYVLLDRKFIQIAPGENVSIAIGMSARSTDFDKKNNPEQYVAPGIYETEGYIYSFISREDKEPKFKKTFKLKTIIT